MDKIRRGPPLMGVPKLGDANGRELVPKAT